MLLTYRMPKLTLAICLLLSCAPIISGQTTQQVAWRTVVSDNSEFSISVPGSFIVNKDSRADRTELVGGVGEIGFRVSFRKTSKARDFIASMVDSPEIKGVKTSFRIGKVHVHYTIYQGQKIYSTTVGVATGDFFYFFASAAPTADNDVLRGILASLRLNQEPILKDINSPAPVATDSSKVNDLKTSDIVLQALKREQTEKIVTYTAPKNYKPVDVETLYSRPLLVVRQPVPTYDDEARQKGVQGIVSLRIEFKANGNIGKIFILTKLPNGLTDRAILAAGQIKFVPAEIDGKPADAYATREYSFSIY
jgi:hypothetical protein